MTAGDGAAHPETDPVPVAPTHADECATGAADEATHGVDDILGREVALVTLRPVSGGALQHRVDRIRRLARLHHPHLVEVYDVDGLEDDAEHVLVLESVGGRPLDELAAAAPLPLARTAEIGARVASALAQAHRHGVVHGRLGPASIQVEDDQRVWLVGLTASLQDDADGSSPGVDAATVATDAAASAAPATEPTRADDLRALAATLAAVVAPGDAGELERALGEARHGGGSADELSGRLVRLARRDAAPTDTTGAVHAAPAAPAGAAATARTPGAAGSGMRRLSARSLAGAGAVAAGAGAAGAGAAGVGTSGAGAGGAAASGSADAGTAGPGAPSDRSARTSLRGARIATLAAVALLLVLTSGVVIWGQETRGWFGAAQSEPEASAPARAPAPIAPPLPVTLPESSSGSRSSSSDDSRSDSSDSSGSDRSSRSNDADEPSSRTPTRGEGPPPVAPPPATAAPTTPTAPTAPTAPPSTTPPTDTPSTTPSATPPTGEPSTPPSTEPTTPSSGGSTDPDTTSTAPGSTDGADGSDGQQGASPSSTARARTADPDAGARA